MHTHNLPSLDSNKTFLFFVDVNLEQRTEVPVDAGQKETQPKGTVQHPKKQTHSLQNVQFRGPIAAQERAMDIGRDEGATKTT